MRQFTQDDLDRILRASGGDPGSSASGDFATRTFEELGYDSLALLEMTKRIAVEFEVSVPEGEISTGDTPAMTVKVINALLSGLEPA